MIGKEAQANYYIGEAKEIRSSLATTYPSVVKLDSDIHIGMGVPTILLGKLYDWYINMSNGVVYVRIPKSNWVTLPKIIGGSIRTRFVYIQSKYRPMPPSKVDNYRWSSRPLTIDPKLRDIWVSQADFIDEVRVTLWSTPGLYVTKRGKELLTKEVEKIDTIKVGLTEVRLFRMAEVQKLPTVKVGFTEVQALPTTLVQKLPTVRLNFTEVKQIATVEARKINTLKINLTEVKKIATTEAYKIPTVRFNFTEVSKIATKEVRKVNTLKINLTEVTPIATQEVQKLSTVKLDGVLTNVEQINNIIRFYTLDGTTDITIPSSSPYVHPSGFTNVPSIVLEGLEVISKVNVNTEGHVTGVLTRNLPHKRFGRRIIPALPQDNDLFLDGTGNWRSTSWILKVGGVLGEAIVNPGDDVVFSSGTNITITRNGRLITIASTVEVPDPELFDHNLADHLDVSSVDPVIGQLIRYTGAGWENWTPNFLTSFTEVDPVFAVWRDATRTQSTFWGAPYGSSGPAEFRTISYNDLTDKPAIPTSFNITSDILQGGANTVNTFPSNQSTQRKFYTTEHLPTGTDRLSIGAYFYATRLHDGGTRVSVVGHPHAALTPGVGITGESYIATEPREWSINFAGTGSSNQVARSDHDHASLYSPIGHSHNYDKYDRWYLKADTIIYEGDPASVGVGSSKLVYFKGAGGTSTKITELSNSWVVEIQSQNLQSELLKAGVGLTGADYDGSTERTWAVAFAGSGAANTASRSDHNHTGVYLTTETDPTVPAHVKAITSTQISDWNTAHTWGNHAHAGYSSVHTFLHLLDTPVAYSGHEGKTVVVNSTATGLEFAAFSQSQNIPNLYVTNLTEFLAAYNNIRDKFPGGNIYINGTVTLIQNLTLDLTGINIYGSGEYGMIKFSTATTADGAVYKIIITGGNPVFSRIWFSGSTEQATRDTRTWPNRTIFEITTTQENRIYFDDCIFSNIVCGGTDNPNILLNSNYIQYSTQYIYFNKCLVYSHSGSLTSAPAYEYNGFKIKYENIHSDYARIKVIVTDQVANTGNGNTVGPSINNTSTLYNLDKNTKNPIKVDFLSDETAWLGNIGTILEDVVERNNYINQLSEVEDEVDLEDDDYIYFSRSIDWNNHYRVKLLTLKSSMSDAYTHPTGFGNAPATALSNQWVISRINVNNEGHVTGVETRGVEPADINAADRIHTHTTSQITDLTLVNNYLTGVSFNTGSGLLTFTREGLTNLTCSIENRYALAAHTHSYSTLTNIPSSFNPSGHGLASAYHHTATLADFNLMISDANLDAAGTPRPASDVSAWAKAASKPSYTAAEVGAISTGHVVNNITQTNINNWNAAQPNQTISSGNGMNFTGGSGNITIALGTPSTCSPSTSNSLTSSSHTHFISGVMASTHAANNITSTNINNWNTAYGWGNHADHAYLIAGSFGLGAAANSQGWNTVIGHAITRFNASTLDRPSASSPNIPTVSTGTYKGINIYANSITQTFQLTAAHQRMFFRTRDGSYTDDWLEVKTSKNIRIETSLPSSPVVGTLYFITT
jgi:hypothetical protein